MDSLFISKFRLMKLSFVFDRLSKFIIVRDCMALKVSDDEFRAWISIDSIEGILPATGTIGAGYLVSEVFQDEFCFKVLRYRPSTQRDCLIFTCFRDN